MGSLRAGICLAGVVLCMVKPARGAADWPQWRGPNRDGISTETGLLQEWTAKTPKLLWKATGLGKGFSSVAIVGERIFTMGDRNNEQFVIALDLGTQKEVWSARVGASWQDGTRCTPTVDGQLLYAIGTHGDMICAETATGKERWRKSFARDFGGKMMTGWGFSESPLVDGEKVLCTPGGTDAAIVALDKKTGQTIWKSAIPQLGPNGKDGAGYSSMVVADVGGIRHYVQLMGRGAVGVAANDGRFLWGYNKVANKTANITTPVVRGDYVFVSTGYQTGSALLKLTAGADGAVKAEEVYFLNGNTFQNHHGGIIVLGEHLYGGHGHNAGAPACIEIKTGKIMWKGRALGTGSAAVGYAEGNVYFRYQSGVMALVAATPEGFKEKGTFPIPSRSGPNWPHPVIHDGKLYLREHDTLLCYDIRRQ